MFEESYRTLFLSSPAKLSHQNNNLCLKIQDRDLIQIPLKDIANIIIDTPQISLSSSLLSIFTKYKILLFICDDSHLPSGIFTPFLSHYKSSQIIQHQINLSQQSKAIIWQKIIKAKIKNQANLLKLENKDKIAHKLEILQKNVKLSDSTNNEAKASALYFPALFYKSFSRKDFCIINSALNYGYAILRGVIARNLVASGLLPSLGIFHSNQFNPFNLADDIIEPYRVFVDAKVINFNFSHQILKPQDKAELVNILYTQVSLDSKNFPLHRAITRSIWSIANAICNKNTNKLSLPLLNEESNGRKIYENLSDV